MIHLQFMNEPKGKYKIRWLDKLGQVILTSQASRMGGRNTELIKWNSDLAHRMYQMEVIKPNGSQSNINVFY